MEFTQERKASSTETFHEGDLVAVFGGIIGKDEHSANEVTLCDVLIVGDADLIVELRETRYGQVHHCVPKAICTKLRMSATELTSAHTLRPEIGDLVLSYNRSYASEAAKMTSGVLYDITYRLGKADHCTLLCGTDMIEVKYDHLIVLDRS